MNAIKLLGWTLAVCALPALASGMDVELGPIDGNATPAVVRAMAQAASGGMLRFKPGTYHFHEDGTVKRFLVTGCGLAGEKNCVFSAIGAKDLTIDGGGSLFVWHGRTFPFSFVNSTNVTVRNVRMTVARPSYAELTFVSADEKEVVAEFAPSVSYAVRKDGSIVFRSDLGDFDSREMTLSVHSLERLCIQYFFVNNEKTCRDTLPTTFFNSVAEDLGNRRVRFVFRPQRHPKFRSRLPFRIGESCAILLNGRERCNLSFFKCVNARVEDVSISRGDGMGLVALLTDGLSVRDYRVVPNPGEKVSLTADSVYLVNCRGKIDIRDCEISYGMDDPMNIHGLYYRVAEAQPRRIVAGIVHESHLFQQPFAAGDRVEFTDPRTHELLASATVATLRENPDGKSVEMSFAGDLPALAAGALVENASWRPQVAVENCHFHHVFHTRIGGGGSFQIRNNRFERGQCILINALSGYWGETGRTEDVRIVGNVFDRYRIVTYADAAPGVRMLKGVKVLGNRFVDCAPEKAMDLGRALEPEVKGNVRDYSRSDAGHAATVTWRIAPPTWVDDAAYAGLTDALDAHKVTGKVALFVTADGFVHHPLPLDELREKAMIGARRIADLHMRGYEAGFNLLCAIGHLDEMPHTTPRIEGARHKGYVGGGVSASDFCLANPVWRTQYLTPALTALAEAKPDFIWLDDDVTVCWCVDCMRRRHAKIGCPEDYAAFDAWMDDPKDAAAHRRAMLQENRETLADFFAFCAGVVRAVDPKIVIGDMEVVPATEGMPYLEKYAALGGGNYLTYWRPGCDCWTDACPDSFVTKLNRQAWMSVWLPRGNRKLEAEVENWPYQHYGKSTAFTVFETLLMTAVATDGVAYNVLGTWMQDDFSFNMRKLDALEAVRPQIDAFVAAAAGARPRGVWNGVGRDTGACAPENGRRWTQDFPWGYDKGFLGTDGQKAGFPVAYRAEDADLVAPTALAVRSMTDEELDAMFAGGVYLDGYALEAALARGRAADIGFTAGDWLSDTALEVLTDDPLNAPFAGKLRNARPTLPPRSKSRIVIPKEPAARILARIVDGELKEIAPCVQGVYENARGGRICVNGYSPWHSLGDVHSIRQMREVMRWLSKDRLAGCIVGDGRAMLWVRGDHSAVVVNFGADPEEGLSLDLAGKAWAHGIVSVGVSPAVQIFGESRGAWTRYRLPILAPWSVNVFAPLLNLPQKVKVAENTK